MIRVSGKLMLMGAGSIETICSMLAECIYRKHTFFKTAFKMVGVRKATESGDSKELLKALLDSLNDENSPIKGSGFLTEDDLPPRHSRLHQRGYREEEEEG